MTQRVSIINSNDTLLVNDYDLTKAINWLTDETGGVMFSDLSTKPEFALTIGTWAVTAGKALIKVTRTASQPIANESFYVLFENDATKTLAVTNGNKIYIEINNTLLQDPTQIEDTPPSTDYALGKGIGEIKSTASYPTHPNYLKLWEIDWSGSETDVRVYPQIDGDKVDMWAMVQDIVTDWDANITWDITTNAVIIPWWDVQWQIDDITLDIGWPFSYFWTWTDWNVTLSSDTTLTRDMFYNNLTINSGKTLYPNWYKIFVKWTLTNNWTISRNGNDWVWKTAWAALADWSIEWCIAWKTWATWSPGLWNNWVAWDSNNPTYTEEDGVAWGNWWTWTNPWWTWGIWGTSTRWANYNICKSIVEILSNLIALANITFQSLRSADTAYKVWSWSWSWAAWGWNGGWTSWGHWWGSASSGGIIMIFARIIINNWVIEAIWWIWWDWGGAWSGAGWWGWGWGWIWGIVYLVYKTITLWTVTVTWWVWGALWVWGRTNWTAWTNWELGTVIQIPVTTI